MAVPDGPEPGKLGIGGLLADKVSPEIRFITATNHYKCVYQIWDIKHL